MENFVSLSACIDYIPGELFLARMNRMEMKESPVLKVDKATVELNLIATRTADGHLTLGISLFGRGINGEGGAKLEDSSVQRITIELSAITPTDMQDWNAPSAHEAREYKPPVLWENSLQRYSDLAKGPVLHGEPLFHHANTVAINLESGTTIGDILNRTIIGSSASSAVSRDRGERGGQQVAQGEAGAGSAG